MKTPRVQDFDPHAKIPQLGSPMENLPAIQKPKQADEPHKIPTERANAPTPERRNVRRIITRNSFEVYEDQMDALRQRSYKQKMRGELGSMSQMVREAIDRFLRETEE